MNRVFRYLLAPLGIIYGIIIYIRNICYDLELLPSFCLKCKVLSIGNITTGGTGKTPAVIALAKYFQEQNISPAILSRGYRRKTKGTVLVSNGKTVCSDLRSVGDEALLIAHSLKSVPVLVDANRIRGGQYLIKNFSPDIIIMDDAFQHRKIKRDVDVVLLNCVESQNVYQFIPLGKLREPLAQLKRADMVVFTKTNLGDFPENIHIEKYTRAPLYKAKINTETGLLDKNKTEVPFHNFHNKKCVLVSGLASPEGFYRTAKSLNLNVVTHLRFRDHNNYDQRDRAKINKAIEEKNGDFILTTEKDMVKLCPFSGEEKAFNLSAEIYSLPVKFVFENKTLDDISSRLLS